MTQFGLTEKLPGWNVAAVAVVWILTFGLGEEAGWRGWLLPHLAERLSTFWAALTVAGVWIVWHAPAFVFNPTYREMGPGIIWRSRERGGAMHSPRAPRKQRGH